MHASGPHTLRTGRNPTRSYAAPHARPAPRTPRGARRAGARAAAGAAGAASPDPQPSGSGAAAPPADACRPRRRDVLHAGLLAAGALLAAPSYPARADVAMLVGPAAAGGKFRTIGEAIEAAEAGSTITVLPGRYEERMVLDGKFLTIQAAAVRAWAAA